MAALGPRDRTGAGGERTAVCQSGPQAYPIAPTHQNTRLEVQETLVYMQCCGQDEPTAMERGDHMNQEAVFLSQGRAPLGTTAHIMPLCHASANGEAACSFRSPESVEMDEIMAAMVLTSLSCSPVVQSPPQTVPGLGGLSSGDMECGGGELSDSGSSGYWSWDHGNGSPAASPSVTEMDSSPDEGLQMELEQGEELNARKAKSSFRGMYRCLWPSCGKVLTSSVGMKRHIRVLHLGSGSDQSQREEDFYYTKISCEAADPVPPAPTAPQQAPAPASSAHLPWASCGSPPGSDLQMAPVPRPRSHSGSGPGPGRPSPLSQSAPSSFWQIHSEHLYQACSPIQVTVDSRTPASQCWTPAVSVSSHNNTTMVKPRCRSVSVGEQWLQQSSVPSRLQTMSVSPSRAHCSFRKARGEAKKCRKVYGVERKDQWCTACRWKKACQRFLD